jgi:NADH-quinone oxidoreductase subunit H
MSLFDIVFTGVKIFIAFMLAFNAAPIMAWVERRGSALIQNRLGPNRIGPLGLLQSAADGIKFIFKEDPVPGHVNGFYYVLAPIISVIPALMTLAVIPFAAPATLASGEVLNFHVANLNVGVLYIFAVASLGVYGIVMAGWASNNKYALLGSLRSSSQMISYELSMGLSIIGIVMTFQSVHLGDIAMGQAAPWFHIGMLSIPKWGVFIQPLGFLIFTTAAFAETNRLPFDLPEGEAEIVAGYHLEYGSMKFALFQMAEYANMTTASALISTLYFGGWHFPGLGHIMAFLSGAIPMIQGDVAVWLTVAFQFTAFILKLVFFMWFFVWVRWTIPRFRYDQLMDLGWKVMLPLSLLNIFATGWFIYLGWM